MATWCVHLLEPVSRAPADIVSLATLADTVRLAALLAHFYTPSESTHRYRLDFLIVGVVLVILVGVALAVVTLSGKIQDTVK